MKRLQILKGVVYQKIFDDTGQIFKRQYVLLKQLKDKVLFKLHNNKSAEQLRITKTAKKSQKQTFLPIFDENLEIYIKSFTSCLQMMRVR